MQHNKIISNESILLDIDCKRMLRRKSKEKIILDVILKLSNNSDKINHNFNKIDNNFHEKKYNLLKTLLIFLGCFKNIE